MNKNDLHRGERAERRAAPKPARIPSGDRPTYASDEGLQFGMAVMSTIAGNTA